jgi:hypothetical protein
MPCLMGQEPAVTCSAGYTRYKVKNQVFPAIVPAQKDAKVEGKVDTLVPLLLHVVATQLGGPEVPLGGGA